EHNETLYYTIRDKLANISDFAFNKYITTTDAKMRWHYPLGTAGIILKDYDSRYNSSPSDWLKAATEWAYINDPYINRSGLKTYFNDEGLYLLGAYKDYNIDRTVWWANIYNYQYGNVSEYSILRNGINEPIWLTLPNGVTPSYNSRGNNLAGQDYSHYVLNILPEPEKNWHMWFINKFLGIDNPTSWRFGYLLYDKFNTTAQNPNFTTKISENGELAIFRRNWDNISSYLFLKIPHLPVNSNRVMTHHDSMSFDYYDKGDYLLPDSGEIKYRETGYGPIYAKGHNTIMLSNEANDNPGGPVKGLASLTDFENPVHLKSSLIGDQFEFAEAEMNWSKIEETIEAGEQNGTNIITLSSPVKWRRTILFPDKEYFIVLDYINNSQQRKIYNLFHLGSFNHTETNSTYNGTVNGDLEIEGSEVDWIAQSFNEEVDITNGSELKWNTTNINDKKIQMHLYSIPKSEISVEKFWIRIGGYDISSEVDHPLVRFKLNTSQPLYRITAFYTRYVNEPEWNFTEINVGGNGCGLRIDKVGSEDIILLSNGSLISADKMKTDGRIGFVRSKEGLDYFFCRDCSEFSYNNVKMVDMNEKVRYLLLDIDRANRTFRIKNDNAVDMILAIQEGFNYVVRKNGDTYGNWSIIDNNHMQIHITFSNEAEYEVMALSGEDTTPPGSVTGLRETSVGDTWIEWSWNNPSDIDYHHAEIYLDGKFYDNVTAPKHLIIVNGLNYSTAYTISIRTVDIFGNVNTTWINDTAITLEEGTTTSTTTSTTTTSTIAVTTTIKKEITGGSGGGGGGGVISIKKATCFDNLKNCHDGGCEEGIDCGGPCKPCPSCSDGIQNQGEEGVDCGGP
ncbi:MAG: hypothetical protein DRO92_04890, partial [Candidatus Altiarchaeales archaeon]